MLHRTIAAVRGSDLDVHLPRCRCGLKPSAKSCCDVDAEHTQCGHSSRIWRDSQGGGGTEIDLSAIGAKCVDPEYERAITRNKDVSKQQVCLLRISVRRHIEAKSPRIRLGLANGHTGHRQPEQHYPEIHLSRSISPTLKATSAARNAIRR